MTKAPWFDVDRKGLAEVVERRGGKAWLLQELISNAWDEPGVTTVSVQLVPEPGKPQVTIIVEDDAPDGFADLRHAWTLFAPSRKRVNAEARGRFNLGEKLVLALCAEASIETTTGGVMFDHRGRTAMRTKRERGSVFTGLVRMTREELEQARRDLRRLLPPTSIVTTIDGERLSDRVPLTTWSECLWTEIADPESPDGTLCRRLRTAEVRVFRPLEGEPPTLYELGIPVVDMAGDTLHVDVRQKVPLNLERDNVTPSYLRDIRSAVLNHAREFLDAGAKASAWVSDAMGALSTSPAAIEDVLTARFGAKRVSADPNDHEANQRAVAAGYAVIHGGSLSSDTWQNARAHNLITSAGKLFPTPKPFVDGAPALNTVDPATCDEYTRRMLGLYHHLGRLAFGRPIAIVVADDPGWGYRACWEQGRYRMVINLAKLEDGHRHDEGAIVALAMHEFAHEQGGHLDDSYHEELCRLGGLFVTAASSGRVNLYQHIGWHPNNVDGGAQ